MQIEKALKAKKMPVSSFIKDARDAFFKNKAMSIGFIILFFLIIMAIIGPYLNSYTYFDTHLELKNLSPSTKFWFGTDELGRDVFTRIWYGARISLSIGIAAAVIDIIIGMIYGAIAALFGKYVDEIMMRVADIIATIPYLLAVILLIVFMSPGILTILIALTITGWINMARIVRAQILSLKKMPFVEAAIVMGASNFRIIFKHLLPNCMGSIITTMTISIPLAIFTEAFLSFLGLGIQAPISSWGVMVNDGLYALRYYPWRLFFPAFMICLTMLAFNLLADGIRDIFDPKMAKK
ncbi:MAG: Oligopeptide transport system permease protein OppC [Candidatus Anoxychlamydiales bacterium]|uniref:ABC transmembrane type-1 domain-containing protein n=1 Tax=marine sediment metagenome TaxID=412755 RepID=A0A0F9LZH8_9ZZZZ|nr:Oligopeptide transport system permease protein OppC [Candidatus Anoxychlamydiales bacterium]